MEVHLWRDDDGYSLEFEASKFDLTWEGFRSLIDSLTEFKDAKDDEPGASYRIVHLDLSEGE